MKFKKLLGAVCSFLLATTSFLCGGPASAKNPWGDNYYVFMVNSGEDLGNGECDGDESDKTCWDTITQSTTLYGSERFGSLNTMCKGIHCEYLMLNPLCPTVGEAMESIIFSSIPDVFVVVANLAKDRDEVIADLKKHFDQILECQKNGVLYRNNIFKSDGDFYNKEVYPNTVPVVIYGVVPESMEQLTSNEEFVKIAEQIKHDKQGNGAEDGKFKYIHNEVIVRQSGGTHICINIGDKSEIEIGGIYQVIGTIAEDERLQPTLWPNYHDVELPSRVKAKLEARLKAEAKRPAEEEQQEEKRQEEERRKAEEERKKIVGVTLGGLGAALAIGSAIFGIRKGNQNKNKKSKGNKIKVSKAQVQKSQVAANA